MRIAVDAASIETSEPTGVELAGAQLIGGLGEVKEVGDRVLVFRRRPWPAPAPEGVEVHVLEGSARTALWRETRLVQALREHRADVLWSPVTAIPLRTSVPVVATVHELPWRVRARLEGVVRERIHRLRLAQTAKRAARLVCPSEWTRRQLLDEHPLAEGRVAVVPHGVRAAWLLDGRAANGRDPGGHFLHVGGNRPRKNVPLLLDGFRRYRESGGRLALRMVGPGPAPVDLPEGAEFVGYVEETRVLELLDGATAVVFTSESEGFGLPVLEAFARSRPVVTVRQGALVETAGDAALVVEPEAGALAEGLRRIAADGELREELGRRGRERAGDRTWAASATRLLAVLREAASPA